MQSATQNAANAATPAERLNVLTRQAEQGQPIDQNELHALVHSSDRGTRGAAKRFAAHLLLRQAQHDSARLLREACDDLEFRHPRVLIEAVESAAKVGNTGLAFDLWLSAAEHAGRRDEFLPALLYAMGAATWDFQHGARRLGTPADIRRMVDCYALVAPRAARQIGIRPAVRKQRRSRADGRLRLAHVTAQLVDGDHSTSRVMNTALTHMDQAQFETYLVVTESLAQMQEHVVQPFHAGYSTERGPRRIQYIQQKLGIPVIMPRNRRNLLAAAADLHQQLAELDIDVAWFHGSLATPVDWMLCAWQCAPWQVDYGMGIPLHCPQVDYQFFEYAESMEELAFLCRERGIPYGTSPFGGVDMSHLDQLEPYARAQLNVPENHVILGTIGNHLGKRMSPRFCQTVASVLRACPNSTYIVVGPGSFEPQVQAFGQDLCGGPRPRVRFAGSTREAGRWTKTFDVYLNEYPAGGGIAVCEAAAASKPVVGMMVDNTSLAAAGHKYLGEHAVNPATDEAYAARLRELITDDDAREQLGRQLRERYETDHNGRKWVHDVSERILQIVADA